MVFHWHFTHWLSNCYGGRIDSFAKTVVFMNSWMYTMLWKSFLNCAPWQCHLYGTRLKSQMTSTEVKNFRIHVERAINRIKILRILSTIIYPSIFWQSDSLDTRLGWNPFQKQITIWFQPKVIHFVTRLLGLFAWKRERKNKTNQEARTRIMWVTQTTNNNNKGKKHYLEVQHGEGID